MKLRSINALFGYSIAIGTLGFFTRMVNGIDLLTIVFFRALLAAIFIYGFLSVTRKTKQLIPHNIGLLFINALCHSGMMVTFIWAILNTTISNTVVLNHAAPIFAIIFSRIFLKETIRNSTVISIAISVIGMFLLVDITELSLHSETAFGDMMALASGIFFAGSMVTGKVLTRTNSSAAITFWQMALTTTALIPFIQIPTVDVLLPAALPLLGLGFIGTGLSYFLFMIGVEHLDAQVVLIVPTIGLIFPIVGAWLIYGEVLSTTNIAGSILILLGVLISQLHFNVFRSPMGHELRPAVLSKEI
ncbi:MAG: EamA family transporter [Chloroflexota bacterium]